MGVGYARQVFGRALLVLAAAGSGLTIVACGGSAESTGSGGAAATSTQPTTSALTAGEFVDQADAICKQAKGDYLALVRQAGSAAASGESQAKPLQGVADLLGSVESQLADLSPPADLQSTFASYLKLKQNQSAVADRLAQAAADSTSAKPTPEMKSLFAELSTTGAQESRKLANELGLTVCV